MNSDRNCILSIDAGGTFIKAALVCNNGILIKDSFINIPVESDGKPENVKAAFIRVTSLGMEAAGKNNLIMTGIGVCIPGPFDYEKGISLMKHKYASIYGISMRPWFEEVAGQVPVRFIHDSTAFILGATWNSRYVQFKKIAGVIIGTGLGFASMFDSKVYSNPQGGPGISIYSRPFRGKTAEEYVSRRALIANYKKLVPETKDEIDVIDIANLARTGQTEAIRVFEEMGVYLSEILHDILNDNMFECLLLGGAISKSADLFLPALKRGLSDVPALVVIEPVKDIDNVALLGIAKAMFE